MSNNQLPQDWAAYFGLPDQMMDFPMFDQIPEEYSTSEHAPQHSHLSDDPLQTMFSDLVSTPRQELEPETGETALRQEKDQSFLQTMNQLGTDGPARDSSFQLDEIAEKLAKLDEKVSYLVLVGEKCLKAQEHESTKVQNSIRDVKSAIGSLVSSIVTDLLPSPEDEAGDAQHG
ncbi:hypothetical protein J7T55_004202 [Diaporthe amygdali]|uniref:uncharacterized protein n=1 Tax=Phomopsis amygdali TaxID=1214568 RepID=UPI0022FDE4EA|nr:uncharacterized protein J7T55_004202 [Diaporthe amygdali]KAJ0103800.1 hypothetical protein J7T55_004202 [Diaporthe amygdali]